jgi:exodeoxyribonuclease-3
MPRRKTLRIATFNVNGIGTRLQLLDWLHRESPDVVALQELKATDAAFPAAAWKKAGYGALAGRGAGTAWRCWPGGPPRSRAAADCRANPGYAESLPGGGRARHRGCPLPAQRQPAARAEFDYKLRWMERLIRHARSLVELPHPALLLGDFNVIPTDADVYDPKAWRRDALFQPEVREAFSGCSRRAGPMRCGRCTATPRSTPSGTISASMPSATVGCASIICC